MLERKCCSQCLINNCKMLSKIIKKKCFHKKLTALNSTVVNLTFLALHEGSIEITLTVPLSRTNYTLKILKLKTPFIHYLNYFYCFFFTFKAIHVYSFIILIYKGLKFSMLTLYTASYWFNISNAYHTL